MIDQPLAFVSALRALMQAWPAPVGGGLTAQRTSGSDRASSS